MTVDRQAFSGNRAATARLRAMAGSLSAEDLRRPVGEHWTVAVTLAHLAFWDRRVLNVLDRTEAAGEVVAPEIDVVVNDLALPFWSAMPPEDAVRLAIETAEALDARLEAFPSDLLSAIEAQFPHWVRRSLHRGEHLDEAEQALGRG